MTDSDFQTTKLRHLRERWQRLDDLARRTQEQLDRETRVEEQMRLEPLVAEKARERDRVETEIRQLEAAAGLPPAAAPSDAAHAAPVPASPPAAALSPTARSGPPRLFYSYAHEDESLRDELAKHLKLLERQGVLASWHDRSIEAGTDWDQTIAQQLLDADIILLLVSVDFLASDYIWSQELKVALERHENGEARVIPIILRPTDWTTAPFSHLQALPRDARPVTDWPDRDAAFTSIARALREIASRSA